MLMKLKSKPCWPSVSVTSGRIERSNWRRVEPDGPKRAGISSDASSAGTSAISPEQPTSAHAFDRPEVAERWVEHDGPPIHLQVNLAEEAQKAGIPEQGLHEAIDRLRSHGVKLHGLSLMPPRVEESEASRPWMRRLRALVDATGLSGCSMGTSQDWRVALEEGSTCVRIGRWAARGPHRLTRIVRRSPSFKR